MKKLLIAAALASCFGLSNAKSQTVNGLRLSEIRADYIQLRGNKRTFSDKFQIGLEYGQNTQNEENIYIKDDKGKKMEFESTLEFVNKMKNYNYELFQVFSERDGDSSITVYVLKRK